MKRALPLSVVFHLLLLGLAMQINDEQNHRDETIEVSIQETSVQMQPEIPVLRPTIERIVPIGGGEGDCKNYYGGIGVDIDYSPRGQMVTSVHPGYPAEALGIVVGDYIGITKGGNDIRGEIGTEITLYILREGSVLTKTTKRAKICIR